MQTIRLMKNPAARFHKQRAAISTEYVIILVLIAISGILGLMLFGNQIKEQVLISTQKIGGDTTVGERVRVVDASDYRDLVIDMSQSGESTEIHLVAVAEGNNPGSTGSISDGSGESDESGFWTRLRDWFAPPAYAGELSESELARTEMEYLQREIQVANELLETGISERKRLQEEILIQQSGLPSVGSIANPPSIYDELGDRLDPSRLYRELTEINEAVSRIEGRLNELSTRLENIDHNEGAGSQ